MNRTIAIAFCMLILTTAGCAEKADSTVAPPTDDHDPEPQQAPPKPSNGAPPEDPPARERTGPSASLATSINKGQAPLALTFSLDGSVDEEAQLTWTLDFESDGTPEAEGEALPETVDHIFEEVGEFMVTLSVSDGDTAATSSVVIQVVPSLEAGPLYEWSGDVKETCDISCSGVCDPVLYCYANTGALGCTSFLKNEPGGDCIWFPIPTDAVGKDFEVTSTGTDPDMHFLESCEAAGNDPAKRADSAVYFTGLVASSGPETGTVPDGAGCVVIWEWEEAPSTITMIISR